MAKTPTFKVGDRVRVRNVWVGYGKDNTTIWLGRVGVVQDLSEIPWVEWPSGSWSVLRQEDLVLIPPGHVDNLEPAVVKVVKDPPGHVDEPRPVVVKDPPTWWQRMLGWVGL